MKKEARDFFLRYHEDGSVDVCENAIADENSVIAGESFVRFVAAYASEAQALAEYPTACTARRDIPPGAAFYQYPPL